MPDLDLVQSFSLMCLTIALAIHIWHEHGTSE
jgi:hypothetical protein